MSLDDTTLKNIGQRIKEARTQRKVSQERLAEISNLSATYIGRLERGEKTPSLETLIVLAQSMDVSVFDLLVDLETKRGK
ncbi:helix-turn-helix domain-containing protein, partial [Acidobacteria bacterium AH-259-A15]|nr:helix-turn-helix domain-containing protein [Acidobacteria bacterium AH-259-A15]